MMNLTQLRDSTYERVIRSMNLRRPQKEALDRFHQIFRDFPRPLHECDQTELNFKFREEFPTWAFEGNCPEITFHLATGVGKTRLIGAVMTYLYLSQESRHFVIVTPRSEVVRKFLRESQAGHPKYLFHDRSLVEMPEVIHANNIENFDASQLRLQDGPRIWIITPQALAVKDARLKKRGEFAKQSPVDFLRSLDDLVVFFDESHHLGSDKNAPSIWRSEVRGLDPRLIFGTTASVDENNSSNVIYSYDLKKCLNEGLYTKFVRVISEKKDESMDNDDHDKMVLRFGISQLHRKQEYINDFVELSNNSKLVKAVMLVCCADRKHAENITMWLRQYLNSEDAVLLVHSGLKENEYLPQLLDLEKSDNSIKVVVNVAMLTEGWDVSNIYVVAPLRAMATTTLVTQVMGRGLRLPFGAHVSSEEADTLDVLCFGRETMQEVCDKVINMGFGLNQGVGITVQKAPGDKNKAIKEFVPSKKISLKKVAGPTRLEIPTFKLKKEPLNLEEVNVPAIKASEIHSFQIHDPRTIEILKGRPDFSRVYFIDVVTTSLVRRCKYLSYHLHAEQAKTMTEKFLVACGYPTGTVPLEPEKVVHHFRDNIDRLNRGVEAVYESTPDNDVIDLSTVEINVPGIFSVPFDASTINSSSWDTGEHKGIPICGWCRSIFEAVPFDTSNELKIAKIIDRSIEVKWWLRNLPSILRLATPAGFYAPDFAIVLDVSDGKVLLEIKGDIFYGGDNADARIKKNAARKWCEAISQSTGELWSYWFLLDSDADYCETFSDIRENADVSDEKLSGF
jgi:superfamily II DNA or RNA helicase